METPTKTKLRKEVANLLFSKMLHVSDAVIAKVHELDAGEVRHNAFLQKVRSAAQSAEDLAICTSLTSYLANEILAICDAESRAAIAQQTQEEK